MNAHIKPGNQITVHGKDCSIDYVHKIGPHRVVGLRDINTDGLEVMDLDRIEQGIKNKSIHLGLKAFKYRNKK